MKMATNKRKKISRARGTHTHGGGSKKKRRGAGNRGGRGNAGSGKRGDAKKPSNWKNKKVFGKNGFKTRNKGRIRNVDIKLIEDKIQKLILDKKAKLEGDSYIIDLVDLGYNKLLSSGTPKLKMKITAEYASGKAVEKISNSGGEVILKKDNN